MAWLKKKPKKEPEPDTEPEKELVILDEDALEKALGVIKDSTHRCPEVMLATQTCYCTGCPRIGTCAVERMSRSAGCTQSFSLYCSLRDSLKDKPTCGWAEVIMRGVISEDRSKYNLSKPLRTEEIFNKEEKKDVKKKTSEPISGFDTGCDISTA